MRIGPDGNIHLTYCLNVHPGESWEENFQAIETFALAVKQRICPSDPFGLGLRLGDRASRTLAEADQLARFGDFLADNGLYVFTINGFPYGPFHGQPVKADVYAPDWRTPERRDYTIRLAEILAALLPEGVDGTISTVPGSYRSWINTNKDLQEMVRMITETARALTRIEQETGRNICLTIEPEPDCFIETPAQAQQFLTGPLASLGKACWIEAEKVKPAYAAEQLADHVGVCLDAAHAAVTFDPPAQAVAAAYVRKIQPSAAFALEPDQQTLARLADFDEPTYLHQVKVQREDGSIGSFPDIPQAIEAFRAGQARGPWRVHFHVPLFFGAHEGLCSTAEQITPELLTAAGPGEQMHLEIETYTWHVLPDFLQPTDIVDGICREFQWVLQRLGVASA